MISRSIAYYVTHKIHQATNMLITSISGIFGKIYEGHILTRLSTNSFSLVWLFWWNFSCPLYSFIYIFIWMDDDDSIVGHIQAWNIRTMYHSLYHFVAWRRRTRVSRDKHICFGLSIKNNDRQERQRKKAHTHTNARKKRILCYVMIDIISVEFNFKTWNSFACTLYTIRNLILMYEWKIV